MFAKDEKKRVGLLVGTVVVLLLVSGHSGAAADLDQGEGPVAAGLGLDARSIHHGQEWFQDRGRERSVPHSSALDDRAGPYGQPVGFPRGPMEGMDRSGLWDLRAPRDLSLDPAPDGPAAPRGEAVGDPLAAPSSSQCLPHPPIRIQGDEGPTGFVLGHDPVTGTPVHRPGSGVVSGTGTEEDPFVIEGWCIDLSGSFVNGIELESTSAHVEIRGNVIWTQLFGPYNLGILLNEADNVQVSHNELSRLEQAIDVQDSAHVSLLDNSVSEAWSYGILVESSPGVHIEDNTVQTDYWGILVSQSDGALLARNTIEDAWYGLSIEDSSGARLFANVFDGSSVGVELDGSPDTEVLHNVFTDQEWDALNAYGSPGLYFSHNRLEGNGGWVYLNDSPGSEILHNEFTGSQRYGVFSYYSGQSTFKGNHFVGDGAELALHSSPASILKDNTFSGGGLFVNGYRLEDFQHDVDDSNRVAGKPILYVEGESGVVVPGDVGQAFIVDSTGVVVEGFSTSGTAVGVTSAFNDGFVLRGSQLTGNARGAYIVASTAVVVEDNQVDSKYTDLAVIDSNGARLAGNLLGGGTGIDLYQTEDAQVHANEIKGDGYSGIYLFASVGADLVGNTVSGRLAGVGLYRSADVTMKDNVLENGGLVLYGGGLNGYLHDIDTSNTVNGQPIRYLNGASGETVPSDAGQVVIVDSQDITVSGLTLHEAGIPVVVAYSDDVKISHLAASGNAYGVLVDSSSAVNVQDSAFTDNLAVGVYVVDSQGTRVQDNTLTGNGWFSLSLYSSIDSAVTGNTMSGSRVGVEMRESHDNEIRDNEIRENRWEGVALWYSDANRVAHNDLGDNDAGVVLYGSADNELLANTIEDSAWDGVVAWSSPGTLVRGNNFAGNEWGLYGGGDEPVDAVDNWWGHVTGPEDSWGNPTGQGDRVEGDVDYHMWLLEPNPDAGPET